MPGKTSSTDRIREKKKVFLAREQKIVSAALELLISENIDRVTVSKIASQAGIGKGTVYKHFLTKMKFLCVSCLTTRRVSLRVWQRG